MGTPFRPPGSKERLKQNTQGTILEFVWGRLDTSNIFLKFNALHRNHPFPNMAQEGSQKKCLRVRLGNGRQVVQQFEHLIRKLSNPLGTPIWPPGSKERLKQKTQGTILEFVWGWLDTLSIFLEIPWPRWESHFSQHGSGGLPEKMLVGQIGKWKAGGLTF